MIRMKTAITLVIAMIMAVPAVALDSSGASTKLARMDSTITALREQLNSRSQTASNYASGSAIINSDMLYSLIDNLQIMSQELQATNEEVNRLSSEQPEHPASFGHGKLKIVGFLHQHYQHGFGDDEKSSFVSKRTRLGIKGKLNRYAGMTFVGDFANSPKLVDAFITLSPTKSWSLEFGQYKPPFGAEFLTPEPQLPFVSYHRASQLGTDRDIGAGVTYKNKASENVQMKLSVGAFNGSGMNTSDSNTYKNYIGRCEFKLAKSLTLAPNIIIGKTNEAEENDIEDINTYGGSMNWSWRNEEVQAEYHYSKVGEIEMAGWYAWVAHSFHTNNSFLPVVQLLSRYEQYDTDINLDGNMLDRITIGTNLFIDSNYTKLQLNYQINGEETSSVDNDEFLVNFQVAF